MRSRPSLRQPILAFLLAAAPLPSLAAQSLPRSRPEDVGMSTERLETLSDVLDRYAAEERLPGGVVLVARRGHVAWWDAFGMRDREAADSMRPGTLFRIASQTKALVSVAVMILQEEGALLITDPVGAHLPGFANTSVAVPREGGGYTVVEAERPITIRDLLTHTAGIGYGNGVAADRWQQAGIQGWYFAHREEPIAATVARMASLPFDAQPGERWVYGYATDILGAIVERVSGMSLDEFLQRRILRPLGMIDTRFFVDSADANRLATVYSTTPSGLVRAPDASAMVGQGAYIHGPRQSLSGGAGLVSSASDYARFLQMLLNGGALDRARILSPKSIEHMTRNHVGDLYPEEGVGFGLGFSVVTDPAARALPGSKGEYGWGGAYHSTYWVDPEEELVVVYFTQVIPATGLDDFARLRAMVYGAITEKGPPPPVVDTATVRRR